MGQGEKELAHTTWILSVTFLAAGAALCMWAMVSRNWLAFFGWLFVFIGSIKGCKLPRMRQGEDGDGSR